MGRKATPWPDLLRHQLWYRRIRQVFGEDDASDYWLDLAFAGNDQRSSADAVKTFSLLRQGGCPDLTEAGPRGVDVVARVEAAIPGSAEILTSRFWAMLVAPPVVGDVTYELDEFLAEHRMERCGSSTLIKRYPWLGAKDERSQLCAAFEIAMRHLQTPLQRLTFLALVSREADFGGASLKAEVARSFSDQRLEWFLLDVGLPLSDYYLLILNRINYGVRDVGDNQQTLRALAQSRSSKWIVPTPTEPGAQSHEARAGPAERA